MRQTGIQVFRLYSTLSPITKSQCRFVMVRVSPSHPYNAGRARTRRGVVDWVCTLHAVSVLCFFGDDTRLEFREVASKGAAQPFIIVYVRFV